MSGPTVEFSRPVPAARVGKEPLRQEIAANEHERAALARRLDLVSLERFSASVELARQRDGTILLTAKFSAAFEQTCVVTLDPVAGVVSESFALRYGPPKWEADSPEPDDEPAFEPLTGDTIDIGEAVAQELALALPPFPRAAGVSVESELGPEPDEAEAEPSPFAVLGRLAGGADQ
jgi:uncharacterized metal-binding protein YceD (DUF177 family)